MLQLAYEECTAAAYIYEIEVLNMNAILPFFTIFHIQTHKL